MTGSIPTFLCLDLTLSMQNTLHDTSLSEEDGAPKLNGMVL